MLTKGPQKPFAGICITGDITEKCPEYTGVFHVTNRTFDGNQVLVNDHGRFLYSSVVDGVTQIRISDELNVSDDDDDDELECI